MQEAARQGQIKEYQSITYNSIWFIVESYCQSGQSVDSLEPSLHDLWYTYYQYSRHVSHESTEQDRLILDILRARGRGPLIRPAPGGGIDIARTPDGTIWNDLPFLATDMTDFWINDYAAMGAKQHLNTSTFFAKLASTRVANNKLCQIALVIFRATFKATRPLGSSTELDNEDPHQVAHTLTIAALLPSACAWFQEAGHNIILLSDVSWNDCSSSTIGKCGLAFANSELGQRSPGGFNPWRWLYWMKQLHDIADEAAQADEKLLAEHAMKTVNIMSDCCKERNSRILRVFKAAGDTVQQDKAFEALTERP